MYLPFSVYVIYPYVTAKHMASQYALFILQFRTEVVIILSCIKFQPIYINTVMFT